MNLYYGLESSRATRQRKVFGLLFCRLGEYPMGGCLICFGFEMFVAAEKYCFSPDLDAIIGTRLRSSAKRVLDIRWGLKQLLGCW